MVNNKFQTIKLGSSNTVKVRTDLMLRIARGAQQVKQNPPKRVYCADDNKSLSELFDIKS